MARGKSPDGGRQRSRLWLGPPGRGGERLSQLFDIDRSGGRDLEAQIEELRAEVHSLERQLQELTRGTPAAGTGIATSPAASRQASPRMVELNRVPLASDRNYWLAHCEGFTVYIGETPLGAIECIRFQSRIDRPDLLEVRCGRFGRQAMLVPVEEVDVVDPDEEAVVLQVSYRPSGAGQRLRTRLNQLWTPHHAGM